jgi:hypothetical protein
MNRVAFEEATLWFILKGITYDDRHRDADRHYHGAYDDVNGGVGDAYPHDPGQKCFA